MTALTEEELVELEQWSSSFADSEYLRCHDRLGQGVEVELVGAVKKLLAEVRRLREELSRTDTITLENHNACCDERERQERAAVLAEVDRRMKMYDDSQWHEYSTALGIFRHVIEAGEHLKKAEEL